MAALMIKHENYFTQFQAFTIASEKTEKNYLQVKIKAVLLQSLNDSVAQQVEHIPFKDGVLGSSPSGITIQPGFRRVFCFKHLPTRYRLYFLIYLCRIRLAFKKTFPYMKTIGTNTNLAEAIMQNHNLLRVIGRFDIQPGFGDVTVGEICHKKDIDPVFMVVILNSFLDESYFPAHDLTGFSLKQLVRYLQKTHDYYLNHQIPYIQELIDRLCSGRQPENPGLKVVNKFFAAYCRELKEHISREEKVTFPYVLDIESRFNHPENAGSGSPDYTIYHYESEHDNVEEKLYDLKNIMIKYLPQPFDFDLVKRIIAELYWLEKDLNEHARIEDKIMIPKVRMMEAALRLHRN